MLGLVPAINIASKTLAPDNTLDLPINHDLGAGVTLGVVLNGVIGLINSTVSSFVIPTICAWLTSDLNTALMLSMAGRLIFTVLVPAVVTLILDQRCGARWLSLWTKCAACQSA